MIKVVTVFCLAALMPASAFAAWKIERGAKLMSLRNDPVGELAKLPAKAPFNGVSAYLQIECFVHPEVGGRILGIVLSKPTTPGAISWRYQFDDGPVVQRGPYTRLSLTVIGLGDFSQDEYKGLTPARRLRVTLLPQQSAPLSFDFDVTGTPEAIKKVPCNEVPKR